MEIKSLLCASEADACARLKRLLPSPAGGAIAIVPAAGRGVRAGLAIPKQYQRIAGKTMLARSVLALSGFSPVAAVVVVLDPQDTHWQSLHLDQELGHTTQVIAVKIGGATRRDSVLAGLALVGQALDGLVDHAGPWILVHDAARPGLSFTALERLWSAICNAQGHSDQMTSADQPLAAAPIPRGAILAMPVADTLKKQAAQNTAQNTGQSAIQSAAQSGSTPCAVESTVPREHLWAAQTPQVFRWSELMRAYTFAPLATDEASAIEAVGGNVALVLGETKNFKVTQPQDFLMMEALMSAADVADSPGLPFAIGQGVDVHALVAGRPLILGGVTIPYEKGLDGHSDADVLLHAITDAILGAAGLGDIGRHFPDSDPAFKGADSRVLLTESVKRVVAAGWRVGQIDATVIAQAPKISPYATQMQAAIAACCGVAAAQVNIKGKTTEHLGFTGRGEGIAAQAVAMLVRHPG
jgi:2-C-methyl-D-erythritol 4-phosphate cytidylyltransferase / 2-C-methyl-D-erythritol 2,4-cyclodiphosphate synthase